MFYFTTVFTEASNQVTVYPYQPASYQVEAPFAITAEAPPEDTPLCIRFYDATEIDPAARYNTVTGPDWLWPSFSNQEYPKIFISKFLWFSTRLIRIGYMVTILKIPITILLLQQITMLSDCKHYWFRKRGHT